MASNYIGLPASGPVDPTQVKNTNYEYKQVRVSTVNNLSTNLYSEVISENGVYLYEVRVVGIESETSNAVFKRSFTAYKSDSGLFILTPQSDYTQKTDATWAVFIEANTNQLEINVKGSATATVNWVGTVTKTMGF